MKPTNFARYMSLYLTEFLPGVKGVSYNTIASKRDTYMLLLKYLKECQNLKPDAVDIPQLSMEVITDFLEWLETTRSSSISTRNIRLAAIKSLFSYIQMQTPDYIYQCQQILSIPRKKEPEHNIEYLTVDGIKAVLDIVDTSTKQGVRDLALLSIMYDSAARVQEIADLCVNDFRTEKPSTLRLTGKGQKTRIIPLMDNTVALLIKYIHLFHPHHSGAQGVPLFFNRNGEKLTRAGISYILSKYVDLAKQKHPSLIPETVSPHGLRHSKSMHMLQAGVPLIYIRDFLGHSEISTTVLKGELAVRQSIALVRTFKKMKDYILENRDLIGQRELLQLSMETANNRIEISKINSDLISLEKQISDVAEGLKDVVTKSELADMMNSFISDDDEKWLMYNAKFSSADEVYESIYRQAKSSIYVVDNYIGLRTLVHLKNSPAGVDIILFSDNVGNNKLHNIEFTDFCKEYPTINISMQKTGGIFHDRFIVLDYGTADERVFLCGASSKDAGARITSIVEDYGTAKYNSVIAALLKNSPLILPK